MHLCNFSEVIRCPGPFGAFHEDSIHMCCIVLVPPRDFMEIARYRLVLIANGTSILPLQFPFSFKYLCFRLVAERKIKTLDFITVAKRKKKDLLDFLPERKNSLDSR